MKERTFNTEDDEKLKEKIIKEKGYFDKEQYAFSKRLNQMLADLNFTNKKLADDSELSEGSISNYVGGKRIPNGYELEKLSNALHTSNNYLLGLTDCTDRSTEELERLLGLSENAMKSLAMLNSNIEEIEDLMDSRNSSPVHRNKLKFFSDFISDFKNFPIFLTYMEQFVYIKQKLDNVTDNDTLSKSKLEYDLIRN